LTLIVLGALAHAVKEASRITAEINTMNLYNVIPLRSTKLKIKSLNHAHLLMRACFMPENGGMSHSPATC